MTVAAVVILTLWAMLNCFFGYRMFRAMAAFYTIVFVAIFAVFLVMPLGSIVILLAAIAGIVAGWFLREFLYYAMVFMMGAMVAMGVVVSLGPFLVTFIPSLSENVRLVLTIVAGLIGGSVAVCFHKPVFVIATAVLGGVGVVVGAEYFLAGNSSLLASYSDRGPVELLRDLFEEGNFLMLLVIAAMAATGILVQCHFEQDGWSSKTRND